MNGMNVEHHITMLLLTQTGTYQEQPIRPFVTNVNGEAMQALATDTREGQNFGVAAMQNAALANLIALQGTTEGVSTISQGWRSRRFRGIMRVMEKSPFMARAETQRVYFIYTDHCEDSYANNLDPRMRIYFNSETIISDQLVPTANGVIPVARVMGSYQIVAPVGSQLAGSHSNYSLTNPSSYTVRPEDVYNGAQARIVAEKVKFSGFLGDSTPELTLDGRSMLGGASSQLYNKRSDLAPARYLSRTLQAQQHAQKEAEVDGISGQDQEVMLGNAGSFIANPSMVSNTFFGLLRDRDPGFTERGYITYGTLCSIFPHLDSIAKYSMDRGNGIRNLNMAEHSNHFNGSDPATMAASLIAQVVPGIMMDNFIQSFGFTAMNGQGPSQYNLTPLPGTLMGIVDNLEMDTYVAEFFRRVVTDVLESISMRNNISFNVAVHADLGADTVIDISLQGAPAIRYVIPSYTDALFSSVVTQSFDLNEKISKDLIYVAGEMMPTKSSNQVNHLVNTAGQPLHTHQVGNPNDSSIL